MAEFAFPHAAADEDRRLELFEQRLDPLTRRRVERLGVGAGARWLARPAASDEPGRPPARLDSNP